MGSTLGLAIVTKNEEKTIDRCLNSVPFARNKIVVDSFSTDRTVELARQAGAQVIIREWPGYPKQKQFAIDQLTEDWILLLDGDEILTIEAQEEISALIRSPEACDVYRLPIYPVFLGRILRHGNGPSFPPRLIKKGKGFYNDREVHEEIIIKGTCGVLKYGVKHESAVDVLSRYDKIKRDLLLEKKYISSDKISLWVMFVNPLRYFLSYIIKRGAWRDGVPGLIWLSICTFQLFLQNAIQYENSLVKK
jgi:glycosyltransferase involved in cell wall biosynthesis